MIGFLSGKIKTIFDDGSLIILSNGVGWKVNAVNTGAIKEDQEIELFIHTNVREDDISLWGFTSQEELSLFKKLLSISGVGAKTALNIITSKGYNEVVSSIYNGDAKGLKVSSVGAKTAEKIIIELRDKVPAPTDATLLGQTGTFDNSKVENVKEALKNLGYKERDIVSNLTKLDNLFISDASEQDIIKKLLSTL
ncbi:Holliday junction branch migration protein RuvA [Candidatus Dojkabacteria bacterium]|uniref:Holliday junction branch migration complex subunit RuvA n=1 Tax=Candidatus Dojkabacteria bacterium TaxID=2099670 RepID=A0A955L947_9BACT|nr:Holliday junction branch migration protein RuvA [Candidatus Dojkabacteria bacterium]